MNSKIIIGWVVLVAGLAIIAYAVNSSFQFFTAKADFPAVFKTPAENINTSFGASQDPTSGANADAQAQAQQAVSQATFQAFSNILPAENIVKLLNAITWSIFATFLVYAGFKIAEIGIKL
jgi:hypothetical protein